MGILKVGVGAAQGVLADSWREYFYCDAMDVDVLAKKGEQRQSKRGFNTKKSENIISNGSIIVVNEGQCMMIVEQGKVVEVCAEAGEFLYDSATEPRFEGKHQGKLPSVRQACRLRRRPCGRSENLLFQYKGNPWE